MKQEKREERERGTGEVGLAWSACAITALLHQLDTPTGQLGDLVRRRLEKLVTVSRDARLLQQVEHALDGRGGVVVALRLALLQQLLHRLLKPYILPQVACRRESQAIEELLAQRRLLVNDHTCTRGGTPRVEQLLARAQLEAQQDLVVGGVREAGYHQSGPAASASPTAAQSQPQR